MSTKNSYDYLRIDCLADVDPVEVQSSWRVTESNNETITIYTSALPDGSWVYGYLVNWANGRLSVLKPSAAHGRFRSQREAKLYAIGFMLLYQAYFLETTCAAIRSGEAGLLQSSLF